MNKKTKRGIILTSLASIAFAGSLLAGSTYALFTSESKTNIVVSSGTVDVKATIDELKTYSGEKDTLTGDPEKDVNNIKLSTELGLNNGEFVCGGTANLVENKLTLTNAMPGDKVTFNIKVTNYSNVATKYRTFVACEDDTGLFAGLNCKIGEDSSFSGLTNVSNWTVLNAATNDTDGDNVVTLPCTVELPTNAGNAYQGKKCTITYTVEAVQGNAATTDKADGTYELYNVSDLEWFRKNCNNFGYNITVKLMKNIDLNGVNWAPINWTNNEKNATFDGNGYTISNFSASYNETYKESKELGFFGDVAGKTIQNLNIDNATISGIGRSGALVGRFWGNIYNCKVTNSTVTASLLKESDTICDDGDKVGAIVGYFADSGHKLEKCTVEKCTITGYRDVGGACGYTVSGQTITDNKVLETKIHYYSKPSGYTYDDGISYQNPQENVDYIVGKKGATVGESNTYDNTSLIDDGEFSWPEE